MDGCTEAVGPAVHDGLGRARAILARIRHHYGPCEAELVRYAGLAHDRADDVAVLVWCERRLESVVRRAGFVPTRPEARRAIVRGHVLVNGRKVIHPGYLVRAGDVLSVRPRPHIEALYRPRLAAAANESAARWLRVEPLKLRATVARLPSEADVALRVDVAGVMEFVSH
jgi:small subunit ribosomal protein S4